MRSRIQRWRAKLNGLIKQARNPNTWLKPKNLFVVAIIAVLGFAIGIGNKVAELWLVDSWNKKILSLEYSPIVAMTRPELDKFSDTNGFSRFD